MFKRSLSLLLLTCLVVSASRAAADPFSGDWRLNPARSAMPDRMKVDSVGGKTYAFDFGGGAETVVVDGTDQPTQLYGGGTLSVAAEGETWKVVRKRNGRILITAVWSLSKDGSALTDHYTSFNADGSPYHLNYVYKRKAGGSGFAGDWVSTSLKAENYVVALRFQTNADGGVAIIDTALTLTGNMQFPSSSVRRLNEHAIQLMRKQSDGTLTEFIQLKLSSDLKTLTMTPHAKAGDEPRFFVFERQ